MIFTLFTYSTFGIFGLRAASLIRLIDKLSSLI